MSSKSIPSTKVDHSGKLLFLFECMNFLQGNKRIFAWIKLRFLLHQQNCFTTLLS